MSLAIDLADQKQEPKELSPVPSRIQVRQYNDPELLGFFNEYGVEYDLIGDHLFIIHGRKRDLAAGPGDRLVVRPDREVDVERGDYALRAQRAITRSRTHTASAASTRSFSEDSAGLRLFDNPRWR